MITDEDIDTFTQGWCNIFAEELNHRFGYPIRFIGNNSRWLHAVVQTHDGRYLDIRGTVKPENLFKEYHADKILTPEEVDYNMGTFEGEYYNQLREYANDIINDHKYLYT